MKKLSAVLVAVSLLACAPAHAQKLDLTVMTCKQFIESSTEHIGLILMWLSGFYTDEDDPPIVDIDKMKEDAGKISAYCAKNPTSGLMAAVEEALEK